MNPPTSRSATVDGPSVDVHQADVGLRQLVVDRVLPGVGPSERSSGKPSTMPMTPDPAARSPPRNPRRRTTMVPRSTTAAVMASMSGSGEANGWRSSTKGPWGMRYFPQAERPKPKPKRPTPRKTPSSWVWPPTQ